MEQDYLAVIFVGAGGGSYARDKDKDEAISRVMKIAASDWKSLIDFSEKEVKIAVWDVTGHSDVGFENCRAWDEATAETLPAPEIIDRTFPKIRKPAQRRR